MPQPHGFKDYYRYDGRELQQVSPFPLKIVASDTDLYYHIALGLYTFAEESAAEGRNAVAILPVGPVFQYRRFRDLLALRPLDLSHLTCFFMDEYLDAAGDLIPEDHPLSFRGFIEREFAGPLVEAGLLKRHQIRFPDPRDPAKYDDDIAELGGAGLCQAGVGINGHLAFNEAAGNGRDGTPLLSPQDFAALPSRTLRLSEETRITNSHTALSGAFEAMPTAAVTVGMASILAAERIRIYCNRPWQRSVIRKSLCEPPTATFPVTLLQNHADTAFTITGEVAEPPAFVPA